MRPGQLATMRIDAYPERAIRGHVASVQPGSGTAFSLLPAENATGNYVKIVQRVPVKLVIDNPPTDVALGPGMSVVPSVRVEVAPSLYERGEGHPRHPIGFIVRVLPPDDAIAQSSRTRRLIKVDPDGIAFARAI
jgi:hypothetical protein